MAHYILIIILLAAFNSFAQSKGGRDRAPREQGPKSVSSKQSRKSIKKRLPPKIVSPPPAAEVEIHITPPTSSLVIENSNEQLTTQTGIVKLVVSPGSYTLNASSPGHQDQRLSVSLTPGSNNPISISLVPLVGYLTVSANVSKASIRIHGLRLFYDKVDNFEIAPGMYRVEISKDGYKASTYDVKIEPAKTTNLAAKLEKLPPVRTGYAMSVTSEKARHANGEYHILQLSGTSGDTNYPSGLIEVTLFTDKNVAPIVNGMLPGIPCQVDFRSVDDVVSISIAERPSQETRWGRLTLHVFPKKNKKESKFILNWYAIRDEADLPPIQTSTPPPDLTHRSFVDPKNHLRFNYPLNWREYKLGAVYFAPEGGISRSEARVNIDRGMIVCIVKAGGSNLRQESLNLSRLLLNSNASLRQLDQPQRAILGTREALVSSFSGKSETTNQIEIVTFYTVMLRKDELLYIALVRPQSENNLYLGTFGKIIREFQFY
jgi:hypothetical protein